MSGVRIEPFPAVGAEVRCGDVAALTSAEFDQLETAFREFGLLVFREQFVSDAELVEFARRWGSPVPDPDVPAHPAHPEIGVVEKHPDAAENFGGSWHTDHSHLEAPPLGTLLVSRLSPVGGGDTRFASLQAAWDALDSASRRHLEGLTVLHRAEGADPSATAQQHPLAIRNPTSGRVGLYLNPASTVGIVDLEPTGALALLNQLLEHATAPDLVTTVRWDPGTMVLWDNRSTLHQALNDYPGERRIMHRVALAGEPLPAAASPSQRGEPTLGERAGATVAGAVITAAMLGLGEVIEPDKVRGDVEIVSEAPESEPLQELNFGDLPPLD